MARLEIEGLCKGWDFPVIDRMDLTVEEGEFFVVVGPSGIGKTTLLRLIAGLESPNEGRIILGGNDISRLPPYKRPVAMTFESYALYPHLSVFENIASPLRARRLPKAEIEQRVKDVARLLKIDQLLTRRPAEVSGGQKQRTALGRTLVAEPEVFLLDEPISHLDAKIRHELRAQFHTLEALRRVANVYVTHDYAEALSLGDRIGVMGRGGLVQIGSAHEVFEKPQTLFVAEHLGQPSINVLDCELTARDGVLHARHRESLLTVPVAQAHVQRLNGGNADRVSYGIRPQHIAVVADGEVVRDGLHVIDSTVTLFEPLGTYAILITEAAGATITALSSPEHRYTQGESIRLGIDTAEAFFFDAVNGKNLVL